MIEFSTDILDNDMQLLLELGEKYGFDPVSSLESEKYFIELLQRYNQIGGNKREFLEKIIAKDFKSYDDIPDWLQGSEWPFDEGKPMIFMGQLEANINTDGHIFTTTFYVFWNIKNGNVQTITQCD